MNVSAIVPSCALAALSAVAGHWEDRDAQNRQGRCAGTQRLGLSPAYSGARLGEVAQMLVADVRELHGVWIFHVTKEGPAKKSVKTAGSERVVPIHSKLIELGFLKYHASMQGRREGRLFPEIEPDTRGYMSGTPSTFLNDYLRDIGVKVDKSVSMHSFGHTITEAFRAAGYIDEQFNMLLGHTKATTTGRYGIM